MEKTEAEKLFLEKMAILNKSFLHFIECALKETPDADLSPSVHDYLKHVDDLDRTYSGSIKTLNGGSGTNCSVTSEGGSMDEEIVIDQTASEILGGKKVDDNNGSGDKANQIKTASVQEKPLPSSIKSISLFSTTSIKPSVPLVNSKQLFGPTPNTAAVQKITFDSPKSSSSDNEKRGRKRAKRGGPEGADEEVIISDHNTPNSARHSAADNHPGNIILDHSAQSPQLQSFLNSKVEKVSFTSSDSLNNSITTKSTGNESMKEKSPEKSESSNSGLLSAEKKDDTEKSVVASKSPKFNFGESPSKNAGKTDKSDEKGQCAESSNKPSATPIFSFIKPTVTTESLTDVSQSSKSSLGFKFNVPSASQSESNNEAEDAEYIPPKAEAVIADEPNAIYSTKCSIFVLKGKEYDKLGIGQLHIKKDETDNGKKILLVRAATATGTVWLNSYINDSLKYAKIDDVKLRVSCVNGGSPTTYLIRLANSKDREKVEDELLQENSSH